MLRSANLTYFYVNNLKINCKMIPILSVFITEVLWRDNMMLNGKRIMVVGASRGIGSAIAHGCALEGASVVLVGRNQNTLEEVASELKICNNAKVSTLVWDVSDVNKGPEIINSAAQALGGLDVIIHNAGVIDHEPLLHVTEKEWDKLFDINVKGAYFCIQAAINYYLEHNEINERGIRGKIVVVSSETGNQPHPKPYGVSKWAVMGMCKGFAKAFFKDGIVISNIAPGPTATEMMRISERKDNSFPSAFTRMADPEEIADLAVFLSSDKSNRIAGQPIYINGGLNW